MLVMPGALIPVVLTAIAFCTMAGGSAGRMLGRVSRILVITSGMNLDSPPRRVEISISN